MEPYCKKKIKSGFPALLAVVTLMMPLTAAYSSDIDFSCMKYRAWGKPHVSDRYHEFDIVLHNQCPGSAYWTMCIERMDSDTHRVLETHHPTGYIEPEQKARVNLLLKRNSQEEQFRGRFQEFYVNIGFDIDGAADVACYASQCEVKKRDIRTKIKANEAAWEKAENRLTAMVTEQCPDSAWEINSKEECEITLRSAEENEMEQYLATDQVLREQLAGIDPERCKAWSGDLVPYK